MSNITTNRWATDLEYYVYSGAPIVTTLASSADPAKGNDDCEWKYELVELKTSDPSSAKTSLVPIPYPPTYSPVGGTFDDRLGL
jgi:hypothetical protein